jgi:hypothetical protein
LTELTLDSQSLHLKTSADRPKPPQLRNLDSHQAA